MNDAIQRVIHHFEVGQGVRWVRWAALLLALVAFCALYDYRHFRNLARPEAMDAAQVARNLARGEGYTTRFIRPLSVHLLEQKARAGGLAESDAARLKGLHPDLANPPVYPMVLAAYMWLVPFDFDKKITPASQVHAPDLRIAMLNQLILLGLAGAVFGLGRSLFDGRVGGLAAIALLGSDLLWKWSIAGIPNLLLASTVTSLVWVMVAMDRTASGETVRPGRQVLLGMVVGLLLAVAGLTVYAAFWLAVPVLVSLALIPGLRRRVVFPAVVGALLLTSAPWLVRNSTMSGNPFGVAGYAVLAGTRSFPEATLERSLEPLVERSQLAEAKRKVLEDLPVLLREFSSMGGSWVSALFLVGLMVPFADRTRSRTRWLVLGGLVVTAVVQCLSRTQLSVDADGITSENLVAVWFPLVAVFGAALFSLLLDQVPWDSGAAVAAAIATYGLVVTAPVWLGLLSGSRLRVAHPPYYPPYVRDFSSWLEPGEVAMSDIPWAIAWYGDRKCMWLTRWVSDGTTGREDFFAVNDFRTPVAGVYLSPVTIDARFGSEMFRAYRQQKVAESLSRTNQAPDVVTEESAPNRAGWPETALRALMEGVLPGGFPLKSGFSAFVGDGHLIMMDRKRWNEGAARPAGGRP